MVSDMQLRRCAGPRLWCEPKATPQSPSEQLPKQTTDTPLEYTDSSGPRGSHPVRRRPQPPWWQTLSGGIFPTSPIRQHPQGGHCQHQPVPLHPSGAGPLGVLPLPAHSLEGTEAQLHPDPQSIPTYSNSRQRQVGQHNPGFPLPFFPYHQQGPKSTRFRPAENGALADPGVAPTSRGTNCFAGNLVWPRG